MSPALHLVPPRPTRPVDDARHAMRRAARHSRAALLALGLAVRAAHRARRRAATDRASLAMMSDHELRDLGIGRGEIDRWCSAPDTTHPAPKGPRP